jgi:hypothetical protein
MNKTVIALTILSTLIFAKPLPPKMGCILAQKGDVTAQWSVYGDAKLAVESKSDSVKYTAIKKEGKNFNEILIGSTIQTDFQNKQLVAKIIHIQSKKRIARGPRHGVMVFNILLNGVSKDVPTVYFYKTGDMSMKGLINLKDFKLSDKDTYTELIFELKINSIVCAVKH